MKLAVMMAAYNAEAYIGAALGSILAQRDAATLDIIVVNDGSTDRTAEIVAEIARASPEIRLIQTENQGVTRARNVALDALAPDTDLVTFLDADDLVCAGRYSEDIALFDADPELDLTYGALEYFRTASADGFEPAASSPTARLRTVQLGSGMYRYRLVQKVGAFDIRLTQAEDTDYLLRVFEAQPRYLMLERTCLYYRRHDNNMTRDRAVVRREFARALLYSVQRRKAGNLPPLPPGIFDAMDYDGDPNW